jgi:hypothetical protein
MLPWRRWRIGASQAEGGDGEGEMEGVRAAKVLDARLGKELYTGA